MHPPPPQHLAYQGDGQASETSSVRSVTQRMETIGERVPLVREVSRSWGPSGASSSIAPPDAAQLRDLADMQTEAAQGEGADATAAPAAEAEDPDDARTYVLLTKEGNSTKFTRDQVLGAIALEATTEGRDELPEGLPNMEDGRQEGPFRCVMPRWLAAAILKLGNLNLYNDAGYEVTFDAVAINEQGRRIKGVQQQQRDRTEAEAEERRLTVVLFFNLPLRLVGLGIQTGPMQEVKRRLENAARTVGPIVKKVTVHQPRGEAWRANFLTVYVLCHEGTSEEALQAGYWGEVKHVVLRPGERPLMGRMAMAKMRRMELASCCLRHKAECDLEKRQQGSCAIKEKVWQRASFDPRPPGRDGESRRSEKLARTAILEAEGFQMATGKHLQSRISKLCKDFQVGKCLYRNEVGCEHGPHAAKRFSRAHILCASAKDTSHVCPLGKDCPYRGHLEPQADSGVGNGDPPPAGGEPSGDGDGEAAAEDADGGEGIQTETGS